MLQGKFSRRAVLATSAAVVAMFGAGQGFAQTASKAAELDTVIVTAQKREQSILEVPQAISVVSGAALEEMQASTFADYMKLVPGLQLTQSTPGQGRLVIRGINTGGVASTVGVYMDETPFGSSSGLANGAVLAGDFDTFDVARVEVLRGPQGTFYGASSMGGVLKFVTNAPALGQHVMRGRANVESVKGGGESYGASAVANLPLGETMALRLTGAYRDNAGFIDSIGTGGSDRAKDINDSRSYGGRAQLLVSPNDRFTLRLTALAQNIEADAPTVVESDPNTLEPLYGGLTLSQFIPAFSDVDYRVYNATGDIDLGFAELASSTSYTEQKQTLRTDLTQNLSALVRAVLGVQNEFYLGQNTNLEKFTQELRLTSKADGPFEWLVGAYYNNEKGLIRQAYHAVTPGTLNDISGLPVLGVVQLPSKYEELAGFANVTLNLGEAFSVDVGGRYSENKQSATQTSDGILAGGARSFSVDSSEEVFTYSVAPRYKLSENSSLYGRVAKGFRPGGPNVVPPAAPSTVPRTFESDSVVSYELGMKSESPNGLRFEVALFRIDWKDIQLITAVNGFGVNINGGAAKSQGVEFNASIRPAPGFVLSANGAYTNAKLEEDTGPLVGGKKGDRLPFTPKLSVGLNADYRWSLSGDMDAYVGGTVRHQSSQSASFDATFQAANGRQRKVDGYNTLDLRAGVDLGRFTLEAYAKNLGDSRGNVSTSGVTANGFNIYPNGAIAAGVIRPRTIGASVSADF